MLHPARTAQQVALDRGFDVPTPLQPFVEHFWSVRWDLAGGPAFRSEVLSHPSAHLSLEEGTHPRFGVPMPAVLVHGVVTRRFIIDLVGAGRVCAAKFRPGGWTALTGCRPARDSVAPLSPGLGLDPGSLLRAVLHEGDDSTRWELLGAALTRVAPQPPTAYVDLLALLDVMVADRHLVRVDDVARRAGVGVRSLQRLFAQWVGVSPKAVLARFRLQDAAAAIDAGEVEDLAGLAVSLGWFDQAHFSRDFRAAVGTTPSAYLRAARAGAS